MEILRDCNFCGKVDSSNLCAGCLSVAYCSNQCQKRDWKNLGHKQECENCKLDREMIHELVTMEAAFLKKLLDERDNQVSEGMVLEEEEARFSIVSIRMALVLAKINPCCFVEDDDSPEYARRFYDEVANPWFAKHRDYLVAKGFVLRMIQIPLHREPNDNDDHLDTFYDAVDVIHDEVQETGNAHTASSTEIAEEGMLFQDSTSLLSSKVDLEFSKFDPECRHCPSCVFQRNKCQGYPGSEEDDAKIEVVYVLQNIEKAFEMPEEDLDDGAAFAYLINMNEAADAGHHFKLCRRALVRLGFSIAFHVGEPDIDSDDGDEESYDEDMDEMMQHMFFHAWEAAANNDPAKLIEWTKPEHEIISLPVMDGNLVAAFIHGLYDS
jgi:hypothetical protein